jgi:hypothetical protein
MSNENPTEKKVFGHKDYSPKNKTADRNKDPHGDPFAAPNPYAAPKPNPKFLPFITNQTGPESIFKALVQRSKGLSGKQLFIIYSAILVKGISEVQDYLKTLDANLTSNALYESVALKYQQLVIPVEQISYWGFILLNNDISKIKNFDAYSFNEISVMFSAMVTYCPEKLEEINFNCNPNLLVLKSDEKGTLVSSLKNTVFAAKSKRIGFTSEIEFNAYLAYREYSYKEKDSEIFPVFINLPFESLSSGNYSNVYCVSPYLESSTPLPSSDSKGDSDAIPF